MNLLPSYTFKNLETGEEWTEFMSISARDEFVSKNPHIQQQVSSFSIIDPLKLNGTKKIPDCFKERLREIKNTHYGSSVNTI